MAALSPADVQRVFTRMREKGTCSNTRRRIFPVLSSALDVAVEWGILAQNPAAQLQIPRREKKEMRAMNREEAQRFLEITDGGRWAEYFRTMLITGMRPGESYALRWEDIDFEHGVISVQRSLIWKDSLADGWMLVEPKTERGRRQISIPRSLVEHFRLSDAVKTRLSAKPVTYTKIRASFSLTGGAGPSTPDSSSGVSSR